MALPKNKGDEKILSYLDVVMRRSDLDILRGPHYLTDCIIKFYFTHLASLSPSLRALLLPPCISFWLTNCPDPQSLASPPTPSASPIGTSSSSSSTATSTSPLPRVVPTGASSSTVGRSTSSCTTIVAAAPIGVTHDGDEPPRFVEGFTPQQTNGHDCKLFVMAIAKVVYDWYVARGGCVDGEDRWFAALKEEVDSDAVNKLRDEVLRLILSLMEPK